MPHWLLALLVLIGMCALGVYLTHGIDGFTVSNTQFGSSAQDAISYALSLGMGGQYTPYSSLYKPFNYSTIKYSGQTPSSISEDNMDAARSFAKSLDNNNSNFDSWYSTTNTRSSWVTPTKDQVDMAQNANDSVTGSSVSDANIPALYKRLHTSPESAHTTNSTNISPSLRDLIRSDIDEAVSNTIQNEIMTMKNEYQL